MVIDKKKVLSYGKIHPNTIFYQISPLVWAVKWSTSIIPETTIWGQGISEFISLWKTWYYFLTLKKLIFSIPCLWWSKISIKNSATKNFLKRKLGFTLNIIEKCIKRRYFHYRSTTQYVSVEQTWPFNSSFSTLAIKHNGYSNENDTF